MRGEYTFLGDTSNIRFNYIHDSNNGTLSYQAAFSRWQVNMFVNNNSEILRIIQCVRLSIFSRFSGCSTLLKSFVAVKDGSRMRPLRWLFCAHFWGWIAGWFDHFHWHFFFFDYHNCQATTKMSLFLVTWNSLVNYTGQ